MTVRLLNVNLMHDKQATEKHFKRITDALGFDTKTEYLYLASHHYKNTSISYLKQHYKCLSDITDYYFAGHLEYNQYTLAKEYERDLKINSDTPIPENYFIDDSSTPLEARWYSSAEEIYKFILKKE
ncbi:homoserine O-succinyltransferase [Macrococcoides caseolyticum]|uniref:homoserine O-acetyltransferase/O-succinyltransferase family protein n=1 Tax=Macrococcoides caseolyticum TaxID=69966 RepID=UPI001C5D851F|nr:homoserine O-succinyltransferase [Macrococcus caseolyticus]MDJ1109278.1 homoserine O-succinyltransferase [Macrococcus caseolyticus]QYA40114.1 homoserine O-succinyltransferase [Macrococcus caseolyticus]